MILDMKKLVMMLLALVASMNVMAQDKYISPDLKNYALKGQVKSFTETEYYVGEDGSLEETSSQVHNFDKNGKETVVKEEEDPEGIVVKNQYDKKGRLLVAEYTDIVDGMESGGGTTYYTYAEDGTISTTLTYNMGLANGTTYTSMHYDGEGQKVAEVFSYFQDGEFANTQRWFRYANQDAKGNPTEITIFEFNSSITAEFEDPEPCTQGGQLCRSKVVVKRTIEYY